MKIIAHRGASGYAPGNTLSAFSLALKMGLKAFEADVHRTKDGRLVACHDYEVRRPGGDPLRIALCDYAALKKVNVGDKFGFPSERVPLLDEVLDLLSPAAEWINIEVKNDGNAYPGIEEDLLAALRSRPGLMRKTVLSSFDYGTARRLRALDAGAALAYLEHGLRSLTLVPAVLRAKAVGAVNFHFNKRLATRLNVALARKAGLKVCVYTVNDKAEALRMARIGVDGIFSDYPDILARNSAG